MQDSRCRAPSSLMSWSAGGPVDRECRHIGGFGRDRADRTDCAASRPASSACKQAASLASGCFRRLPGTRMKQCSDGCRPARTTSAKTARPWQPGQARLSVCCRRSDVSAPWCKSPPTMSELVYASAWAAVHGKSAEVVVRSELPGLLKRKTSTCAV